MMYILKYFKKSVLGSVIYLKCIQKTRLLDVGVDRYIEIH